MGLAKPAFAAEARWQSETLADEADVTAARAELDAEVGSAPVVVYTYGLSPFSSEALALLDGTGATYRAIELGPEWFLLNGRASAKRTELLERTWVGRVAPLLESLLSRPNPVLTWPPHAITPLGTAALLH